MDKKTTLEIQLTDLNDVPLAIADILLDAILYTQGRKRYQFFAGRTDAAGHLNLRLVDLDSERLKNQAFSLMDYNTAFEDCDSRIDLVVLSPEEIRQQQGAIRNWFSDDSDALKRTQDNNNELVRCNPIQIDLLGDSGRYSVRLPCSLT